MCVHKGEICYTRPRVCECVCVCACVRGGMRVCVHLQTTRGRNGSDFVHYIRTFACTQTLRNELTSQLTCAHGVDDGAGRVGPVQRLVNCGRRKRTGVRKSGLVGGYGSNEWESSAVCAYARRHIYCSPGWDERVWGKTKTRRACKFRACACARIHNLSA